MKAAAILLDLVLMIDVSHSVSHPGFFKTDRDLVPQAAAAIARVLKPDDRVRLGAFGTTIAIGADVSTLVGVTGGPSPLWDALDTSRLALTDATGRRGIIVVTDGRSTANRIGFAEILARLERDRLPVFVVALDLEMRATPDPSIRMRQLAERTGGDYIVVKRQGIAAGITHAVALLRR
jgi:hypothetical protein